MKLLYLNKLSIVYTSCARFCNSRLRGKSVVYRSCFTKVGKANEMANNGNNVEYNRHFFIQNMKNITDFSLKDYRGHT